MDVSKMKNPLVERWKKLPPFFRNRYFITLVAFLLFMIFIDRHDVFTQFKLRSTVERLEGELEHYDERIKEVETEKLNMELNREQFARESYYMQKDNEDVFIIVEE